MVPFLNPINATYLILPLIHVRAEFDNSAWSACGYVDVPCVVSEWSAQKVKLVENVQKLRIGV